MSRFAPKVPAPTSAPTKPADGPRQTTMPWPVHDLGRLRGQLPWGQLQRGVVERATSGVMQPKLAVGAVDSPAEREADALGQRFADHLSGHDAGRGVVAQDASAPTLHRQSATRAPSPAAPSQATHAGAGHALPEPLRAQAEDFFGRGLGHVRVHDDGAAERSARRLDANAYTVGADVVFSAGRYAPSTPAGQRLLGHELTHVVQQSAGEALIQRDPRVPDMSPTATFTPRDDDAASNPLLRYVRLFGFLPDEARADLLRAMIRREARFRGETTTFSAFSSVSLPVSAFFPGLTLLTRDRIRWELLPTLATTEGLTPGAGETLTAIAQSEALRTYLRDKLDLEVRVELLDPDATAGGPTELRYTVLHAELTPEQGALRLDSLDAVSIAPLATVVEHAAAEARQLARVALVQRQASLAVVLAQNVAMAAKHRPGSVAMRSITELAGAIDVLSPQIDRVGGNLTGANADLRDLVTVVATHLHTARTELATAQTRLRDWQGTLPETTDHEELEEIIAEQDRAAGEDWQAGGLRALNPLHAFAASAVRGIDAIRMITSGGLAYQETVNARAYRAGGLSYDDYLSNGWSNLGLATVLTVVGALSAGLGTEIAVGVTGLDAAALNTSLRGMFLLGASQGLTSGVATAVSNDVYSSVAASLSSSQGTRDYHARSVGGPGAWMQAGTYGMAVGGLMAGAFWLLSRMPMPGARGGARGGAPAERTPSTDALSSQRARWSRRIVRNDPVTGDFELIMHQEEFDQYATLRYNRHTGRGSLTSSDGSVNLVIRDGDFVIPVERQLPASVPHMEQAGQAAVSTAPPIPWDSSLAARPRMPTPVGPQGTGWLPLSLGEGNYSRFSDLSRSPATVPPWLGGATNFGRSDGLGTSPLPRSGPPLQLEAPGGSPGRWPPFELPGSGVVPPQPRLGAGPPPRAQPVVYGNVARLFSQRFLDLTAAGLTPAQLMRLVANFSDAELATLEALMSRPQLARFFAANGVGAEGLHLIRRVALTPRIRGVREWVQFEATTAGRTPADWSRTLGELREALRLLNDDPSTLVSVGDDLNPPTYTGRFSPRGTPERAPSFDLSVARPNGPVLRSVEVKTIDTPVRGHGDFTRPIGDAASKIMDRQTKSVDAPGHASGPLPIPGDRELVIRMEFFRGEHLTNPDVLLPSNGPVGTAPPHTAGRKSCVYDGAGGYDYQNYVPQRTPPQFSPNVYQGQPNPGSLVTNLCELLNHNQFNASMLRRIRLVHMDHRPIVEYVRDSSGTWRKQ